MARPTKSSSNYFLLILIIAIVIISTILSSFQFLSSNNRSAQLANIKIDLTLKNDDWIKGEKTAKAILIIYSDFQCPACRYYFPILKQLKNNFKDNELAIIYRHFPLITIHKNAEAAAIAAEAAGLQGKFWEMHDLLFENQDEWANENKPQKIFLNYAKKLNLDLKKFEIDLNSEELKNKVQNSYTEALSYGLEYTPTFILNGEIIKNPSSFEEFYELIKQKINI